MRRVALFLPPGAAFHDPGPAITAGRDIELLDGRHDDPREAAGAVGWSAGGWPALELAAAGPPMLERLVLVSVPAPAGEPQMRLEAIAAKTLLLFGSADSLTGAAHGRWWLKRLANARLEMVPGGGHDILDRVWPRVLSFLAPRRGGRF